MMRFVGGEPKVLACLLLLLRDSSVAHNLERVNRRMFCLDLYKKGRPRWDEKYNTALQSSTP